MVQAALGGEFEVPAIDGSKSRVKIPAGTQSGRRFRLQGKGMPVLRSKPSGGGNSAESHEKAAGIAVGIR
jgi:molecular chaperone DnaJ